MSDSFPERMFARARELRRDRMDYVRASQTAWLEERVLQWPSGWGDDLRVLIYGDFQPPAESLSYPALGITVHPEKKENTVIRGALTVLEATVRIEEKSVPALIDAARRINLLLGTYTLHSWGNAGCGWWSWVTHGTGGGVLPTLAQEGMERTLEAVLALPRDVRRKIEAALFWVREPRNLMGQFYKSDVLRIYSAYWNAFECLVDAVDLIRPRASAGRADKQAQIDAFIRARGGQLSAEDIQACYQSIVNPGFVGKSTHALVVCFGEGDAAYYADECFRLPAQQDRLYNIRNAINHGDIDAENVTELIRIEARLSRLWIIVWGMFGRIVPFPTPVDTPEMRE